MADSIPVTNISVDSSVDTVQLHNLSPNHKYSVQLATAAGDVKSELSEVHRLYLKSPLTVQAVSYSHGIPTELWVIAFLVVIMMTLIIILVVSIIVIRTRRLSAI